MHIDQQLIETIVTRGVERVFPNEDFLRSRLLSGEQLTVYLGIDPTGPTLHMGHVIPMIKLRQLQQAGHKIILLIGDFTARIGDPDKQSVRQQLSHEEVLANAQRYQEQASLFLDFEGPHKAELKYNGQWLDRMNFQDVLELSSQMTVQRMLDRDMFRRRIEEGSPIYLHEFMYPLMQGYDSVAMQVDGEVGGNDQTFNMLVGRDLLKNVEPPKEKFVIPMKLLVDEKGEKMGKTTGNMISFLDTADQMYKKIMTWSDDMILLGFELLTSIDLDTVARRLASDENPRDIKFDLASTIVSQFHGDEASAQAKETWIHDVQQDAVPTDIPEVVHQGDMIDTLVLASGESRSQVKRLCEEGAIKINGAKATLETLLTSGDVVQIGKKRWYQVVGDNLQK